MILCFFFSIGVDGIAWKEIYIEMKAEKKSLNRIMALKIDKLSTFPISHLFSIPLVYIKKYKYENEKSSLLLAASK